MGVLRDFLTWLLFPEGLPDGSGGQDAYLPPPFPMVSKVTTQVPLGISRIAKGVYAGNGAGGGQAIACGLTPQAILVQDSGTTAQITFAAVSDATVTLTATGFTALTVANTAGHNYAWVAYAGAT